MMTHYVREIRDYLVDEGGLTRHSVKAVRDTCKNVDIVTKLSFTSYGYPLRRVYFPGREYVPLWDIIDPEDYNKKIDTAGAILEHIRRLNEKLGGCETYIIRMEEILSEMAYVQVGDWVLAEHVNKFIDYLDQAIPAVNTLYRNLNREIEVIEGLLRMAEGRFKLITRRKWGDPVLTRDHNLIVDIFKPLQVALQLIEANC